MISAAACASLLGVASATVRADAARADVRAVAASILAGSISPGALIAAGVATRYGFATAGDESAGARVDRRTLPAVAPDDAPGVVAVGLFGFGAEPSPGPGGALPSVIGEFGS